MPAFARHGPAGINLAKELLHVGSYERRAGITRVDVDGLGVKGIKEALVELRGSNSCYSYLGAVKRKSPPVVISYHVQYMRGHMLCARDGRRHVEVRLNYTGENERACDDCFSFIRTFSDGGR